MAAQCLMTYHPLLPPTEASVWWIWRYEGGGEQIHHRPVDHTHHSTHTDREGRRLWGHHRGYMLLVSWEVIDRCNREVYGPIQSPPLWTRRRRRVPRGCSSVTVTPPSVLIIYIYIPTIVNLIFWRHSDMTYQQSALHPSSPHRLSHSTSYQGTSGSRGGRWANLSDCLFSCTFFVGQKSIPTSIGRKSGRPPFEPN